MEQFFQSDGPLRFQAIVCVCVGVWVGEGGRVAEIDGCHKNN